MILRLTACFTLKMENILSLEKLSVKCAVGKGTPTDTNTYATVRGSGSVICKSWVDQVKQVSFLLGYAKWYFNVYFNVHCDLRRRDNSLAFPKLI